MSKTQIISQRLDELKGILLLDSSGNPYLLKGHTVKTETLRGGFWPFFTEKEYTYISDIELSTEVVHFFEPNEDRGALRQANILIEDRKRYLKFLSGLSKMGYTIKRK